MKTEDLIIGKAYFYKGEEVICKGEENDGFQFFKFEGKGENGSSVIYRLYEYEVNELITEIK